MKSLIFFLGAFGWFCLWLAIGLLLETRGVHSNGLYWILGTIATAGVAAWMMMVGATP